MKKLVLCLVVVYMSINGQNLDIKKEILGGNSITIVVKGFSDKYAAIFYQKRSVIEGEINRELYKPHQSDTESFIRRQRYEKLAPIYITVNYEEGNGYILMEVNYVPESIVGLKDYQVISVTADWKIYCIDLHHIRDLLGILNEYKYAVACAAGWDVYAQIFAFDLIVRLRKSNGDWFAASAFSRTVKTGSAADAFPYYGVILDPTVRIKVDKTAPLLLTAQNDINSTRLFRLENPVGLDGNLNSWAAAYTFFNIPSKP